MSELLLLYREIFTLDTSPWLLHVICCTCPERHSACCRATFEIAGGGLMRLDAGSARSSSQAWWSSINSCFPSSLL